MSISSTTNRVNYTGNGASDTYNYTFRIFDEDHLLITVRDTSDVETTLTKTTHYTVTGVGELTGGTVALVNGAFGWIDAEGDLKTGYVISIRRVVPLLQETDIRNQGEFYPEIHEDQFDLLVMADQQQQDEIDRSVKLAESIDPADFDSAIPAGIAGSVSVALVTNATGDGWAVGPTSDEISNAQGYATAASNSASAASTSATLAADWASKTNGQVATTDYSAKAWAIGGTGVTDTASAGASKEWAIETASTVDGTEYSAKEYAVGTQIRGLANKGSAKDWATYISGTVDNAEYSAKKYAQDAAQSAADAATYAAASNWNDVVFKAFADSPVSLVQSDSGKLYSVDCSGGNVVINLPLISGLNLTGPFSIGILKSESSANTITINANGTDTVDGSASYTISLNKEGVVLVPDTDTTPDKWTVIPFGSQQTVLPITSGGTGQTTATAAFNALSPVTTKGDIITRDGTNNVRLAIGGDGTRFIADAAATTGNKWGYTGYVAKSADYTAVLIDEIITVDASGAARTITLPTAASVAGKCFKVKKTDSSVNGVIIATTGGQTIDGMSSVSLFTQYDYIEVVSDGSNWYIVDEYLTVGMLYTGNPPTGTLNGSFNKTTYGTKINDPYSAYASGLYTVPFKGKYSVAGQAGIAATYSAGNLVGVSVAVDGVATYSSVNVTGGLTGTYYPTASVHNIPLNAGQTLSIQSFTQGTTTSFSSDATVNWISIVRTGR